VKKKSVGNPSQRVMFSPVSHAPANIDHPINMSETIRITNT